MEQERIARENEEKEKAEKAKKIKEQFDDPNKQWEKDKTDLKNLAKEGEPDADPEVGLASAPDATNSHRATAPDVPRMAA